MARERSAAFTGVIPDIALPIIVARLLTKRVAFEENDALLCIERGQSELSLSTNRGKFPRVANLPRWLEGYAAQLVNQ
jgi:hypothetical protein